jgi:hypothetical protein
MARNILQVSIKDSDTELIAVADYLRSGSVTVKGSEALKGYYLSLSIAESPDSSREDRDKSLFKSLSLLKQQMCFLMDYHFQLDGTVVTPESFSAVVINPMLKEYGDNMWASTRSGNSTNPTSGFSSDGSGAEPSQIASTSNSMPPSFHHGKNGSTFTTIDEPVTFTPHEAVIEQLSRENQELSDEIDREIVDRSSTQPNLVPEDEDYDEEYEKYKNTEDEDDDYDPDDDLTDDEYAAKVLARIPNNQMVITD